MKAAQTVDPAVVPQVPKSRTFIPLLGILVIVILGSLYLYINTQYPSLFQDTATRIANTFTSPSPSPLSSPPPTAPVVPEKIFTPLPTGSQTYKFSHGDQVLGPKISEITIDPLEIKPGEKQTITLLAAHTFPITSVSIEIITDTKTTPHTLDKIGGTNQDGTWQGTWEFEDTTAKRYGIRLILKSSDHDYDNIMVFRN